RLSGTPREGGRSLSRPTVARKLASIRSFYRYMVERGERSDNPADLVPSPPRPKSLPKALRADQVADLLDRIPAQTPLETRAGACRSGSERPALRRASRPMYCATPLRPTCSRAGPTCARSRSFWVTRACPPRSYTLG